MISVVNMVPQSLSGETSQDSEPNIAVNPANPSEIVATAFTAALGGMFAPIYVSTDGGATWSLRNVVPGNGSFGTGDITVGFATAGGTLYAGTLNGQTGHLQILRTASFASTTPMTLLVDRASEDQPWVVAGTVTAGPAAGRDRVFVGNNRFGQPAGATATVDLSQDARTAAAPSGFGPHGVERRPTLGQDGPPIRLALHPDGTVYAAHERWVSAAGATITMDIVVTRDNGWGAGPNPFGALVDAGDGFVGQRVAVSRIIQWNAIMGQERLGGDLAIAVDPNDSGRVWVAWCDRVGGAGGTDWTLHVRRSTNRGQTWSVDLRTVTNAKNPSLAMNSKGSLGLLYQQFTGTRWTTQLELTDDGWQTAAQTIALHTAPSNSPPRTFLPYLGDYVRLLAVDDDFYGVFCGNNTPDLANFPQGVKYQRNANWATHSLLNTDNVSPVASSIDPFFFRLDGSGKLGGKLDHLALYRPGKGTIWILKNTAGAFTPVYQQGDPGNGIGGYDLASIRDQVFAFDYDSTGKLDHLALYRPGTGTIWILKNTAGNFTPVYQQGDPGNGIGGYDLASIRDQVFAFDYDSTGKLDHLALYRPGTGTMWILKNTAGTFAPVYQQGAPGTGIGGYDLKRIRDRAIAFDFD